MLMRTFLHLPNISEDRERLLWSEGVRHWDTLSEQFCSCDEDSFKNITDDLVQERLLESRQNLQNANARYFGEVLPHAFYWRFFPEFRQYAAYLDIETTGLSNRDNAITTIALYDGKNVKYYVRGINLDDFCADIMEYKLIITYNGKLFDLPFIEREFGIKLPQAHIDLRFLLRSVGYSGGLKACERQLGISRNELENVTGYHAVLLWQEYLAHGSQKALETLLAYNIEDVINLEMLMIKSYNMKLSMTPFGEEVLEERRPDVKVPFHADTEMLERVSRRMHIRR